MTAADKIRSIMSESAEQIIAVMEQWTPEQRTALSEAIKKSVAAFDEFRMKYPGKKRGVQTEFNNFKKRHKDWREVLPLLSPAVKNQIQWRKEATEKGIFVPPWCNLQTWINQRRWEETQGETVPPIKTKFQTAPTSEVYKPLKIEHQDPPKPKNDEPVPTLDEQIETDIEKMKGGNGFIPKAHGIKFARLWITKKWRPTKEEVEKFHERACDEYIRELKKGSTYINNRAAIIDLERTREFTGEHKSKVGVIAETIAYMHFLNLQVQTEAT